MDEAETWDEQRERLQAMTVNSGTWDLSDSDRAAIAAALEMLERLGDGLRDASEMLSRFGADDAAARADALLGEEDDA